MNSARRTEPGEYDMLSLYNHNLPEDFYTTLNHQGLSLYKCVLNFALTFEILVTGITMLW